MGFPVTAINIFVYVCFCFPKKSGGSCHDPWNINRVKSRLVNREKQALSVENFPFEYELGTHPYCFAH